MSKALAVPTPKPVVVEQVCSLCEEDWAEHPENATALDCIEILKAKRKPKVDACCGHHYHTCCHHFWHYWSNSGTLTYQQPYQITYTTDTKPTWTINTPLAGNTAQLASLSNQLSLVS